jgi:uroporphyrinogen decarboxylase
MTRAISKENPQQGNKLRMWQQEHRGIITSREELDAHEWPGEEQLSLIPLDYTSGKLAQGQKLLVFQLGIFECLNKLMGLETLAIQSIDDPGLVNDLAERLTQITEYTVGQAAAHPATGAIFYADDMGYNTGPFLSPGIMREIVFPKMKRIADACHRHGKPFILHSCGNIELLMEDLIEMVGIDARHSFQDNAYPVEPFHEKYSSRIGIVGGMDVDLLSRGTVDEVRSRTRQILEACAPKGRYAMGSGNSVTNYCKVENFYAMVDETRKWNEEHE